MKEPETYNEAFKRRVVSEVLSGSITKEEARIRYGIGGNSAILDWIRKFAGVKMRSAGVDPLPILQSMKIDENHEELKEKIKQLEAKLKHAELKGKAYQVMVEIASGAGFLIPISGKMMRMPGLPAHPAAVKIDIDALEI